MTTPTSSSALPSATSRRIFDALFRHVNDWSPTWFGLIFWGSVLFATAQRFWADGPTALQLFASLAIGLSAGLAARRRGYWL